mgnify:FL=1
MKKQFLAKLLALAMVLTMIPAVAVAADNAVSSDNDNGSGNNGSGSTSTIPDVIPFLPPVFDTSTTTTKDTDTETTAPVEATNVDASDIAVSEDGQASIEAKVVDGTASIVLSESAVESLADLVQDDEIVLEIKAEGAGKLNASFPAKALTALAKETGAALTIQSSVATISIPNEVLSNELGTSGNVQVSAESTDSVVGFTIQVSGKALKGIKGVQITF